MRLIWILGASDFKVDMAAGGIAGGAGLADNLALHHMPAGGNNVG